MHLSVVHSGQPSVGLSIVVPMHDEAASLETLHARLSATLRGESYEIVAVDDGSGDGTFAVLSTLAASDPRLRVVRLSRRFGQQVAVSAGLDHCRGEVVVVMDGDLQHRPEDLPRLIAALEDGGYDVVVGVPRGPGRRLTSRLFTWILQRLVREPVRMESCSFRVMRRKVVRAFRRCGERARHVSGLLGWLGFKQGEVEIEIERRASGRSKYGLRRMFALGVDSLTAFTYVPLEISGWLGALMTLGAGALAGALACGGGAQGWAWATCAVLFVGGLQLSALGVLGAYMGRVYSEVQDRPLYVVDETVNLES